MEVSESMNNLANSLWSPPENHTAFALVNGRTNSEVVAIRPSGTRQEIDACQLPLLS